MTTTILTKASKIAGTVIVESVKVAFASYLAYHIVNDTRTIVKKIRKDDEELIDLTESVEEETETSIEDKDTDIEINLDPAKIVSDFINVVTAYH